MVHFTPVSIETKRFILVPHQISDFAESAAMWQDPLVARYTTGSPLTEEEAWFRLLRNIGHWQAMHYGNWVIREKATGVYIGEGGLSDYKRNISPACHQYRPEVSLALMPFVHRKGYSIEILRAMLDWGDEFISIKEKKCLVYPENSPAIRLAQYFGFIEKTEVMYKNKLYFMFVRP